MRSIIRWMILVSICLGGWGLASLPAYAVQSAETRVIRIGYTEHPGFIELAKDGKYRGLGVDYFNEIARYTGWRYEYVSGSMGTKMNSFSKVVIKAVYYVIPNFSAFDFKVQAIYGLPLVTGDLLFTLAYFFVYLALLVSVAVWVFTRRELP